VSASTTSPDEQSRVIDPRFEEFRRTGSRQLRDELVESNVGLARNLAFRFAHRGEAQDELEQVALVGLLKAVERYEPERGLQFSTFAVPTIVGELKRHFRDRGWAVRVPRRMQELYLEINATLGRLSQELSRSPTPAEVAARAGVEVEAVLEALEAGDLYQLSSLDELNEHGYSREPAAADQFVDVEQRLVIEELLATLPARDRLILELRFFDGLTQGEIAERVGMSQMHVSRLITRSLHALRAEAEQTQ
jgi:RNA polymerase sigma-B factor